MTTIIWLQELASYFCLNFVNLYFQSVCILLNSFQIYWALFSTEFSYFVMVWFRVFSKCLFVFVVSWLMRAEGKWVGTSGVYSSYLLLHKHSSLGCWGNLLFWFPSHLSSIFFSVSFDDLSSSSLSQFQDLFSFLIILTLLLISSSLMTPSTTEYYYSQSHISSPRLNQWPIDHLILEISTKYV